MIYPNSVAFSLYTTLSSDATLVNSGFKIDLQEPYNTDTNKTPWACVYLEGMDFEEIRVQQASPWMATYKFQVLIQEHSMVGGEMATDRVMRAITPVFTAINSNRTLDGTVHNITGFDISPYDMDKTDEDYLFTYALNISAEVYG